MTARIILNVFYPPSPSLRKFIETGGQLYIPVNGGSQLCQRDPWARQWLNRDDTGKNISHLNGSLNELTSIYWAWKNCDWTSVDYIGFNHYRRMFDPACLRSAGSWDLLVGKPIETEVSLLEQYSSAHDARHMLKLVQLVEKSHPGSSFRRWLMQREVFAPCNMLVAKKNLFFEWCRYVFLLVFKLAREIELPDDPYQHRALAFLSERLTSWWAWQKANSGQTRVAQTGITFISESGTGRSTR